MTGAFRLLSFKMSQPTNQHNTPATHRKRRKEKRKKTENDLLNSAHSACVYGVCIYDVCMNEATYKTPITIEFKRICTYLVVSYVIIKKLLFTVISWEEPDKTEPNRCFE